MNIYEILLVKHGRNRETEILAKTYLPIASTSNSYNLYNKIIIYPIGIESWKKMLCFL